MREIIIPYCGPIKGITQRITDSIRIRGSSAVKSQNIGIMYPHGFVVVCNLWAKIVHNGRLRGYVLRRWPITEKVKAVSRGIFNPGCGVIVSRLFLGRSGARASRTRSSQSPHLPALQSETLETGDLRLPCYQHDTWVIYHYHWYCRTPVYSYRWSRVPSLYHPEQRWTESCHKL